MIRVPAGPLAVRLDYVGNTQLQALYALMGGAWTAFLVWLLVLLARRLRGPGPA
mgnify:FL=1|jgi:hypothetical protein